MNLYVHTYYTSGGVILRQVANFSTARPETFPAVEQPGEFYALREAEVDSHEALKAIWNPSELSGRQAVVDALPKIQVISTAGTIQ